MRTENTFADILHISSEAENEYKPDSQKQHEAEHRTRYFNIDFDSSSENEGFARSLVSAFIMPLDPTVEEITEIKTAVSEAVSNCIIHGYRGCEGIIHMSCSVSASGQVKINIKDDGTGIEDVEKAMEPLFTTDTDGDRSGMGFTVMESFMDRVNVHSRPGEGTEVIMMKKLDVGYGC